MIEAPPLDNELDRLADLYSLDLLDTFKEERFDRLTRLARLALGADMCYLALIDGDRQWFKSKCGISTDSTGRDISFCSHTIANSDLMVVPDSLEDERFADNPLVTGEPFVRFYAGYPLKGPDGHNVGTFCVADSSPRVMTDDEKNLLIEYAMMAQRELNLLDLIETQNQLLETQSELEKVRRSLQRELNDAAKFVRQKLPPRFDNDQLSFDWTFIESNQLGGDMFGLEKLSDTEYLVYLLDVAGHGISASLLAVSVQNTLRQMLSETIGSVSPARILTHLNASFQMVANQNRFFTMWCGMVDLSQQLIYFANAGHPAPVLFDADLNPKRIGNDSMMVGIVPDASYDDQEISYQPGSRLVIFSDGIIEEMDRKGEQYGRERLETSFRRRCSRQNCGLGNVVDEVREWNGDQPFADDVSLVELVLKD